MKRGTPRNPKVTQLAGELGIGRATAVGILELLWHFTAEFAHAGDVGRWDDASIALALCWDGDSTKLIQALVKCGWLDECPCHRLRVHDWNDHADQTVRRVLSKRGQGFIPCYDDASICLAKTGQPSPSPIALLKSTPPTPPLGGSGELPEKASSPPEEKAGELPLSDPRSDPPKRKRKPKPKNPIPSAQDLDYPPHLDTPAVKAAMDSWIKTRTPMLGIKTPWRVFFQNQIETILADLTHDNAIECLKLSIGNGYRGLFKNKFLAGVQGHGPPARPKSDYVSQDASAKATELQQLLARNG